MNRTRIISVLAGTSLGMAMLATANVAQAFNMGNMMNPGEWFDNDDDYYRHDRYYGGRYGPYGGGWVGPYGGRGGGPYGYGGQPSTIVVNPSGSNQAPAPRLPE